MRKVDQETMTIRVRSGDIIEEVFMGATPLSHYKNRYRVCSVVMKAKPMAILRDISDSAGKKTREKNIYGTRFERHKRSDKRGGNTIEIPFFSIDDPNSGVAAFRVKVTRAFSVAQALTFIKPNH